MKMVLQKLKYTWFIWSLDLRGGGVVLAYFFAFNIIGGLIDFSATPEPMRDDVKEQLELAGYGHLAVLD